jgi:hypothetical protein
LISGSTAGDGATTAHGPVRIGALRLDGEETLEADLTISATTATGDTSPLAVVSIRESPGDTNLGQLDEIWRYFDPAVRLVDRFNSVAGE